MSAKRSVVVVLTHGKSDNGKSATLAFSCAMSGLALGSEAVVFLTGDGAVWGYTGSAEQIVVQGFPPLSELIDEFAEAGGRLLLCSVCHRTCSAGSPHALPTDSMLSTVEIAGFTTLLEIADRGVCLTF
ncbi:MAG: DsrE family protein [Planctomycetales bacterium]|nr:DsrE family protein [Planctomycetales bacterium]MCA9208223.1 DsrE family protein [Planctomycetales bacterium]MCA9220295.1 DsrE family protein [Planctomycetales bacterium]MCA9227324.1 DsrE family protein [Planctomycetales bacterium]